MVDDKGQFKLKVFQALQEKGYGNSETLAAFQEYAVLSVWNASRNFVVYNKELRYGKDLTLDCFK